jgi:hypothetical protein
MSINIIGLLYSASNLTGESLLVGVGKNNRYNPISADLLSGRGLANNIHSLELFDSNISDGNIILFQNKDFSGEFGQESDARATGNAGWNYSGPSASAIVVASNRAGFKETRLSFRNIFLQQWNSFLDKKLAGGQASREGDPTLTWEMFPANVSWLDTNMTYLKIYQPLHISIDWWPDYEASMTYHFFLYSDGNHHLRAAGARWAWWVESGAKSGKIGDKLGPQVSSGLTDLQNELNTQFQSFDGLLGNVTDVYYLPGSQPNPVGTNVLFGKTTDDITIVIEHT